MPKELPSFWVPAMALITGSDNWESAPDHSSSMLAGDAHAMQKAEF